MNKLDEIKAAQNAMNEEGVVINDDHEDRSSDPNYLVENSAVSSYKQERNEVKKLHKKVYESYVQQKKCDILAAGDDPDGKKAEKINNEFVAKVETLNANLEEAYKKLKVKYKDELQYHINPKLKRVPALVNSDVLLSVRHLKQFFFFGSKIHNQKLKAVSNVSFDIKKGECFGIVGESGCGKTTTGRTIIRLYKPTSGSIYYKGYRIGAGPRWNQKEIKWSRKRYHSEIKSLKEENKTAIEELKTKLAANEISQEEFQAKSEELNSALKSTISEKHTAICELVSKQRKKIKSIKFDQRHTPRKLMSEIQMIFQDPIDSLDPRMTVEDIIQEGLIIQGYRNRKENHEKVVEMLEKVGLVEEHASRYPHEFSGGQRQRIGIARALVMNPKLLICDEPISALDVSIRAQVINLLNDLKDEMGLTLIFIAHDLSVVKYFCDRIAVMYFGKLVELATSEELFRHPLHPYTVSLLSAIPKPNPLVEKERVRILYKPQEVHDYSVDKPSLREVCPGHIVYCNEKEFNEYQKKIAELDAKNK